MNEGLNGYLEGLRKLLGQLGQAHPRYVEGLTLEQRLHENIAQTRRHGDTETRRAERSQIVEALNRLALEEAGTSFNELCGFPISTGRMSAPLDRFLTRAGLPPDMPLHERLANLLMISLGQINAASLAVVMQLLALLVLSGLFARWLAGSDPGCTDNLWGCLGIVWLGLTVLPLIAGFLPQRRERRLYEDFDLTAKQRLALQMDKASGAYVSAYLGEITAVVIWLGLRYLGQWTKMSITSRAVFWFVMEWLTFTLSFVGAVIATKYWENLLQDERHVRLNAQHFLLGLGFPLIVYPAMMLFGLTTQPLWDRWQTGCLAIGLALAVLAWLLSREAGQRGETEDTERS